MDIYSERSNCSDDTECNSEALYAYIYIFIHTHTHKRCKYTHTYICDFFSFFVLQRNTKLISWSNMSWRFRIFLLICLAHSSSLRLVVVSEVWNDKSRVSLFGPQMSEIEMYIYIILNLYTFYEELF